MRPRHDPPSGRPVELSLAEALDTFARSWASRRRRHTPRRRGEPGGEPCPVEPNRPLDQSGGAAAALEFGD
ncbi:hypothetical protein AVM11_18770 [Sphingomonas melonis TY]|jgi:hypothetical protein|uniref:Uncharacterized protein n=1 Tax=Sphingomonas melonis TY TaxID=621456 RepID=A0A175Y0L2_9SPHN|nr:MULTISPECIES: hypothetical protein [Sphingomonas]AOW22291.1 hypothetical protein BJP26_00895 [Sphingomonas melonis TY]ATI55666.1 hypothetical protein CP552_08170 [Sphingomonas melonis]KZB94253.1 hypothetical protein AVM11_18770 [Sphingomonas melonis TY]MBI0532415.1 hypothetical protein [Sphingomonas sp. TX0522]MBX8844139.1 hypothetical protein [Sphingomonas melonis]